MSLQYSIFDEGVQASPHVAHELSRLLTTFVKPLVAHLHQSLDLRLVHTFVATLHVLLAFRHRNNGLLLSELGAYLVSPEHAPAGTKRLSNLWRSAKWSAQLIERFLWQQADQQVAVLDQAGEAGLRLGDASVIEKPASIARDRLVRSSIEQSTPLKAHQARLLPSPWWPSAMCARHPLARCALTGTAGTA